MRREYEMSEEEHTALLDACKPVPYMLVGGTLPASQQDNANAAWERLGSKRGFKSMTVRPCAGKGTRFFTAEPSDDTR